MIQPAFDIGKTRQIPANCSLLMEVSERNFNYILYNPDPKQLFHIKQYPVEPGHDKDINEILEEIISTDEMLLQPMKETAILYNFPESNLMPEKHFDMDLNKQVTQLIYGNAQKELILSERVYGWHMYNVYRIPKAVHTLLQQRFTSGRYWHFYTMMLSAVNNEEYPSGNFIRVIFYNDKFVAAFFSGRSLQLLQTFAYETPEDAAYYLLLVCRQFEIGLQDAALKISGLIDEKSALFTELFKYFPDVQYEGVPTGMDTSGILDEYPSHYFSPLLKLSLCV